MSFFKSKFKSIKGDASAREFYRKKNKNISSIIVYAKSEKVKNLLNYDSINKILIKNKILAPKILSENFNKNFIEIEDLGNKTLFDILKNKKQNKLNIYLKILIILKKIQNIKTKKIKNFKNNFYKIPKYSSKLLYEEANLFLKWYVPSIYNRKETKKISSSLRKIIKSLIKKIKLPNNILVHRDFHVSNLMIKNNDIFVIDSQDAVYGNITYDLASLIDDVRLRTSNNLKKKIYQKYLSLNKGKFNNKYFQNDFEILSVLRNLKIIGIFTRLAKRDKKKKYLKLISCAWNLIELRLNKDIKFKDLKKNLENNFSKKIRLKYDY